jgi:hypothetical protein
MPGIGRTADWAAVPVVPETDHHSFRPRAS